MPSKRGRPPNPQEPNGSEPHDRPEFATRVQSIIDALEIGDLARDVRLYLQMLLRRGDLLRATDAKRFPETGSECVTLLLRTIAESSNGTTALTLPILRAVSSCMDPRFTDRGLLWIEFFDTVRLVELLEQIRALDFCSDADAETHLRAAIRRRLERRFPHQVAAVKAKAAPKPPRSITRVPEVTRNIELGLELLKLKARSRRNNDYSALRWKHFPDLEPKLAMQAAGVARNYGQRPEIFRRMSWQALVQLSLPSLHPVRRAQFEARIMAGENVTGKEIARARGQRPRRSDRRPERMAA
jgi:hypothetical protein